MDVILHLGAHRTGSTSFQSYLRQNGAALHRHGVGFWGPRRTRNGLFSGLALPSGTNGADKARARARGRVKLRVNMASRTGLDTLLVSDENMIGSVRDNIRAERLYPAIGERMARFGAAFDGALTRVVLNIRSQEGYWGSALAYSITRGMRFPRVSKLDRLVTQPRSWRDVISDLACALPGALIMVTPFEEFAGRPDDLLEYMIGKGGLAPKDGAGIWRNRSPEIAELREILKDRGEDAGLWPGAEGRWMPFDPVQTAALRDQYEDDLYWLRSGADGLATLIEEQNTDEQGKFPPPGMIDRGHRYGTQDRGLAQAR